MTLAARVLRGLTVASVMASLTIAVIPGIASAHTSLKDSTPADESTVSSALDVVELEFTENVTDPRVEVLDAAGQNHADGEVALDGAIVQQAVGELEPGEYVIAYQVVSPDGDPVDGTLSFTLALPEPTPQAQPTTEESTPNCRGCSRAYARSDDRDDTRGDDRDNTRDGWRRDRGRVQYRLRPPYSGTGRRSPCRRRSGVLRREPNP